MSVAWMTLPTYKDVRGNLTAVEKAPFDIKRAFWIYDMRDWRGGHAHRKCHQLIVAMHSAIQVRVEGETTWLLDPSVGLYVPPGNMVELYGTGAVLVLCSEYYDEGDYIEGGK
jgi:hypothetical protein